MSLKRFRDQDLIHTTIKTHPEYNFIVNDEKTFLQREKPEKGKISDIAIRHVPTGSISLYELNIDRGTLVTREDGDGGVVSRTIEGTDLVRSRMPASDSSGDLMLRSTSRSARRESNATEFDIEYPLSASIGRVYVAADTRIIPEYQDHVDRNQKHPITVSVNENRKYVTALENLINFPDNLQNGNFDSDYKLSEVNMICIPGIFYGSKVKSGSIKLNYYVDGKLIASAEDKAGKIICTEGVSAVKDQKVGDVIYSQGIILLNNNTALDPTHQDKYLSTSTNSSPSWINFGTGIKHIGEELTSGPCVSSAYSITFKGTNKVPTLSMFSFSEIGEHNYSNNPTFLDSKLDNGSSLLGEYLLTNSSFEEPKKNIKSVNKSPYPDDEEEHISTTYISKVGIYDEDKNLIAVATLANPAKKTEKRDFMIKMKIDF